MDTSGNRDRLDEMPEHESDDDVDETLGGGVMSQGGTATDRGTGTLGGVAQGSDPGDDDVTDDGAAGERSPRLNPDNPQPVWNIENTDPVDNR